MDEWAHFKYNEFQCNCGCGQNLTSYGFITRLNNARELAGIPFRVSSGYRCKSHNRRVGGLPTSSHLKGQAADLLSETSGGRFQIVEALIEAGFRRIGVAKTFIHVDNDETKEGDLLWLY